jgi:hypothetical protein
VIPKTLPEVVSLILQKAPLDSALSSFLGLHFVLRGGISEPQVVGDAIYAVTA